MPVDLILLLALFTVVPMPIAGGVPILMTLISLILTRTLMATRGFRIHHSFSAFVILATILLIIELITAIAYPLNGTIKYAAARAVWVFTILVIFAAFTPNIIAGRTDGVWRVLVWGITFLIGAMLVDTLMFQQGSVGRQLGALNLPIPRSTGVPNSDGKIGTFLTICFSTSLFARHYLSRRNRLFLFLGPIIGLCFTQSRSTLLALTVVYAIYWIYRLFSGMRFIEAFLRLFGAIAGVLFVAYWGSVIIDNLVGEGIYATNVRTRFILAAKGFSEVIRSGLFGGGADNMVVDALGVGYQIHNTFLAMSAKSGVFAGLAILTLIVFPALQPRGDHLVRLFSLAMSLGILIEHMLYPGMINEFLGFAMVVPAALAARRRRELKRYATKSANCNYSETHVQPNTSNAHHAPF